MRIKPWSVIALVALASCSPPSSTVTPPPAATAPPPAPTSTTTLPADGSTTTEPTGACPEGDVMLADGRLLDFDRPSTDATRIASIGWERLGDCLRITVDFATEDGAPATTPPPLTARILRSAGVLRVETGTTASVVIDQLVEEDLVERIFVPVEPDGQRFMDFVLAAPVVARARILTSPARLEIELEPGGPAEIGGPLISSELVVIEPGSAAVVEPVLDVTGYSTGELASIDLTVLSGESAVAESTLTLEPNPLVWTAFTVTIPVGDEPYDSLRVSTEDGSVVAGIPFNP